MHKIDGCCHINFSSRDILEVLERLRLDENTVVMKRQERVALRCVCKESMMFFVIHDVPNKLLSTLRTIYNIFTSVHTSYA